MDGAVVPFPLPGWHFVGCSCSLTQKTQNACSEMLPNNTSKSHSRFTSKSLLSCLLLFLLSLILSQALRQPQRPQSFLRQSKAITVRAGPALAAAAAPVRPRQQAAASSGAWAPWQPPDDGLANTALSSLLAHLFSAFPCSEPLLDV